MNENSFKETIKRAIKKGDLHLKLFCYFLIKLNYSNKELQVFEVRNKKFKKIQKKYKKYIESKDYNNNVSNQKEINNNIWICWFQGIENAPDVVKKCIDSIKKYNKNKDIHFITKDNMFDYVQLPQYIIDKWKAGIITNTHLSDILRVELLLKYGGLWMDATTYLTAEIPKVIYKHDLFMFQYKDRMDMTIKCNSWFIYSKQNNRILQIVRDLLFEYWKREIKLKEYFLLHFFITMAFEKYPDEYEKMLYITDDMAHTLCYNFYRKYNKEEWDKMTEMSTINKLTYKLDNNKDLSGTFYDYIINIGDNNG